MSYQRLLALAIVCAIGAFLTIVLRLAHPHHRQVALVIYGIGWIPFILSIRKLWLTFDGKSWQILQWKTHILVGLAFLLFGWAFKVLIPVEKSPLLGPAWVRSSSETPKRFVAAGPARSGTLFCTLKRVDSACTVKSRFLILKRLAASGSER